MKYASWQCQYCGASIGWLGRAIQWVIGCRLVVKCGQRQKVAKPEAPPANARRERDAALSETVEAG